LKAELDCLLQALVKTGGKKSKAARILGVSRRTLGYRLTKYGLNAEVDELKRAIESPQDRERRPIT
jgi:DNA-binding NtrC family response regulator